MESNDLFNDAVILEGSDITDYNEASILPVPADLQAAITEWLQPTDFDAEDGEYRRHLSSRMTNTGAWLWESPSFRKWLDDDDHGLLWLKGIPGSGKSSLAANLISELSKRDIPVLFFFFRKIIDANHSPIALLRDWLTQVLSYSPPLQAQLKKYITSSRDIESVSIQDFWQDLRMALAGFQKVFCVVDALDEMDVDKDYAKFLQELAKLGQIKPASIKVAMTSRPIATIERVIRTYPMVVIRLEEKFIDMDISFYVENRLVDSSIPEAQYNAIRQAVPGRANGIFLYAKLAMDAFLKEGADLIEVLKTLPTDLNHMYEDLLRTHAQRSGISEQFQVLIFSWATHASRPLRLLELADVINATQKSVPTNDLKSTKNLVRNGCGPLLEILPNETICVVHHSLTEFLIGSTRKECPGYTASYPILGTGDTHSRLAEACISYLVDSPCLDNLKSLIETSGESSLKVYNYYDDRPPKDSLVEDLYLQHHFLRYSVKSFHYHVRKAEEEGFISENVLRGLTTLLSDRYLSTFNRLLSPRRTSTTPLHIAAEFGLFQFATQLIQNKDTDINALDYKKETPLLLAAAGGHAAVVRELLAHGARPDEASDYDGMKPLHYAAIRDFHEIVDMLLNAGVSPLTKKTDIDPDEYMQPYTSLGDTPLMYATRYKHVAATKAFLPHLKSAKTVNAALAWAAKGGSEDIVHLILKHTLVNVNSKFNGETPLFLAAKDGCLQVMLILLNAGADPTLISLGNDEADDRVSDDEDDACESPKASGGHTLDTDPSEINGFNALHVLCGAMQRGLDKAHTGQDQLEEVLSLMLEKGLDINAVDEMGRTALFYAVNKSSLLVHVLLKFGADASAESPCGETPLTTCYHPEIARVMVAQVGISDKPRQSDGKTPFLCSIKTLSPSLIRQFKELGVNMNSTDYNGQGALHLYLGEMYRVWDNGIDMVKALLDSGVSPNHSDNMGRSPLHMLRDLDNPKLAEMLVEAGADINARDHEGRGPIFHILGRVYKNYIVKTFEHFTSNKLNGQLDVRDNYGRTPLLSCLLNHDAPDILKHLTCQGLDPKDRDYEGNTLWHIMMMSRWNSIINLEDLRETLGFDIDIDTANNAGQSALHILCAMGSESMRRGIRSFRNIDCKDNDGIRPLHLAARQWETGVRELLAAGASPTECTHEGITPVHVAARFRQPNIVGMLLDAIEKALGQAGLVSHLNTSHRASTPSALQLACRSGVPETVALLLAAGAKQNYGHDSPLALLSFCAEYEEEQGLWKQAQEEKRELPDFKALGIKIQDRNRLSAGDFPLRGLETILSLIFDLWAQQSPRSADKDLKTLDYAIEKSKYSDYTVVCLWNLRNSLDANKSNDPPIQLDWVENCIFQPLTQDCSSIQDNSAFKPSHEVLVCLCRSAVTSRVLAHSKPWKDLAVDWSDIKAATDLLQELIDRHLWNIVKMMFEERPDLLQVQNNYWVSIFKLIDNGLVSLVASILTPDKVRKMEETYHALCDSVNQDQRTNFTPLLVRACQRRESNLPMLRLLVEELKVDLNLHELHFRDGHAIKTSSALHVLASDRHWWQGAEGLQYLVGKGADLNIRDGSNQTPLMIALGGNEKQVQAAKCLLEYGADADAPGERGKTCLELVSNNSELTELLIKHGATVTFRAFLAAIGVNSNEVMDILCGYYDLNTIQAIDRWNCDETNYNERWPLHVAAYPERVYKASEKTNEKSRTRVPMVETLLKHSADPFATLNRWVDDREIYRRPHNDWQNIETTVLHDLLERGGIVKPFFDLPNLDLERRDSIGRTLLLAACDNADVIIVRLILDRGASATARDNQGRNALHHILKSRTYGGRDSLQLLISASGDELINQADAAGYTPLHYALQRVGAFYGVDTKAVKLLLAHGANPLLPDPRGNTALHLLGKYMAEHSRNPDNPAEPRELFEHFLSLGLPINGHNHRDETPLFCFIAYIGSSTFSYPPESKEENQLNVLQLFLDAGADFSYVSTGNNTLLHVVAAMSIDEAGVSTEEGREIDQKMLASRFKWLMDQGLDPMAENDKSQTSLDIATIKGYQRIVDLFQD